MELNLKGGMAMKTVIDLLSLSGLITGIGFGYYFIVKGFLPKNKNKNK